MLWPDKIISLGLEPKDTLQPQALESINKSELGGANWGDTSLPEAAIGGLTPDI